jgi:hypothetical protein
VAFFPSPLHTKLGFLLLLLCCRPWGWFWCSERIRWSGLSEMKVQRGVEGGVGLIFRVVSV